MPSSPKDRGQGIVEYALILILVLIIVFIVISLLGPFITDWLSEFIDSIRTEIIYIVAQLGNNFADDTMVIIATLPITKQTNL